MISRATGHVHMVGICGIGMAGVAYLLQNRGFSVSGCDAALNQQGEWLKSGGVTLDSPQSVDHINDSVDYVIRTPAVSMACSELREARRRGIPVLRRGEVLPALLAGRESVAVAGTHGKTTTATLVAQLLKAAGRDPSWCIGGTSGSLDTVAGVGEDSTIVVEADESDGTLALYRAEVAVVTNIEFDHMEHFDSEEAFEACFAAFVAQTERCVLYCADDPRAARLCSGLPHAVGYGFSEHADLRYVLNGDGLSPFAGRTHPCPSQEGISLAPSTTSKFPSSEGTSPSKFPSSEGVGVGSSHAVLTVCRNDEVLGEITIPVPGQHNALNAMAAVGVGLELGLSFDTIAVAMRSISLPKRRFEVVSESGGVTVVSDYAHHPSEIAALVRMARAQHTGRLFAVFQPHRYSRTKALGADFPAAFDGVDRLVLTPVYAASEQPMAGGRSCDLYARFRERDGVPPLLATSLEQAWVYLQRELREGDMLLVIGAGDVEKIAAWSKVESRKRKAEIESMDRSPCALRPPCLPASTLRANEPLGCKTTYGVGGAADVWVELASVEDLGETLRWCCDHDLPFRILGAGSNVLVSDLGVRGVVARLKGDVFHAIRQEAGEVVVGGAVSLARLLSWAEGESLTGIEFLEGVPGGLGGIVRMNGGAYGHEISERLAWIRGLKRDGSVCTLAASALKWGYRGCEALDKIVIVEVGLQLGQGNRRDIGEARQTIAEKRSWMRGLRCSGSVFRNPPGQYVGRIIEELGLKGSRIGGAHVYGRHGNFIVADEGATGSDVLALIQRVQAAVYDETGIELLREVIFLE